MNSRPRAITALGWLFIAVGGIAFLFHVSEFKAPLPLDKDLVWAFLFRLFAVVGGAFVLRGHNWARWLLAAWMAFHVVLSIFHSPVELLMHILLFGVIGYVLFRPQASAYFQGRRSEPPDTPGANPTITAK
jgi:Trk-type K+ transport system membrane component